MVLFKNQEMKRDEGGFQGSKRESKREVEGGRLRDPNNMAPGSGQGEKCCQALGGNEHPIQYDVAAALCPSVTVCILKAFLEVCRHQQRHESAARGKLEQERITLRIQHGKMVLKEGFYSRTQVCEQGHLQSWGTRK